MDFLIRSAWAEGAAAPGGLAALTDLLPLVLLFVVFYFLLIRPQTKRVKEHKQMVEALKKGDEVVTNGGIIGKIIDLGENFVLVEISLDIQVKIQRDAIATVMPKGTMKSL
ncbi:preprotein translocase subunit YajC [Candidatus Venteria ishoeyi]|uniref:Sec translocon accessory complex subunit YajC n=1 Tax=Candidatus Venteria ishoeyi TaxID=1899563 RepID=A0A1H6F9W6_9GAMM|nr:preprotein translocase subunit YajC [Candidatus Venteria ishoeyi]MDM8545769.1 preprotein translocase subunit YajC [Candidatus Venteria ishoeyi]SEH06878.1 preprotein translocase subunit YajC [Candidatus Venteria ishoeyi]